MTLKLMFRSQEVSHIFKPIGVIVCVGTQIGAVEEREVGGRCRENFRVPEWGVLPRAVLWECCSISIYINKLFFGPNVLVKLWAPPAAVASWRGMTPPWLCRWRR